MSALISERQEMLNSLMLELWAVLRFQSEFKTWYINIFLPKKAWVQAAYFDSRLSELPSDKSLIHVTCSPWLWSIGIVFVVCLICEVEIFGFKSYWDTQNWTAFKHRSFLDFIISSYIQSLTTAGNLIKLWSKC